MNSLKLIVNSWDSLYPPIGRRGERMSPEEEADLDEKLRLLDQELRTSIDQEEQVQPDIPVQAPPEDNGDEWEVNDTKEHPQQDSPEAEAGSSSVLSYLLFLPNYLVIKPLTFVWLLLTYPFTNFFQSTTANATTSASAISSEGREAIEGSPGLAGASEGPAPGQAPPESGGSAVTRGGASDDDETPAPETPKIEILKQENIISNTIKSPSASSKYLIPPPQRLVPLSRNPQRKRRRKTLILDLDETLIHSLSRGSPRSFSASGSSNMIEIKLNNIASLYYVYKRPYCDYFLKEAAKWFELQIFTASVKEYADPIINWLESEIAPYVNKQEQQQLAKGGKHSYTPQQSVFTKRYYRTDCSYRPGVGYIKDLSKFFPREEDLKNVIILDNSPVSYALHEDNAVMIEGWINDQGDRDLLNLLPMLHSLSLCIDVRYILGLRGGEKVFEG